MRLTPIYLTGAFIVDIERHSDFRGFFSRIYCTEEFSARGISKQPVQSNISFNSVRGTLRGIHYQRPPYAEAKLIRCIAGKIFDVIVDLRENSPTCYRWFSMELDSVARRAIYIPEGFAHGFQTLEDESEVHYEMFSPHQPESAQGLRWNDPALAINWPLEVTSISEKDQSYPLLLSI